MNLSQYNLEDITAGYIEGYISLFGKVKTKHVWEMMLNSEKLHQLIRQHVLNYTIPKKEVFQHMLNTIGYFIMAKPETETLGLIVSIKRYNDEGNRISTTASDQHLASMVREIIEEAKVSHVIAHSDVYKQKELSSKAAVAKGAPSSTISKTSSNSDEKYNTTIAILEDCRASDMKPSNMVSVLSNLSILYFEHNELIKGIECFQELIMKNAECIFLDVEGHLKENFKDKYFQAIFLYTDYFAKEKKLDMSFFILDKAFTYTKDHLNSDDLSRIVHKTLELKELKKSIN